MNVIFLANLILPSTILASLPGLTTDINISTLAVFFAGLLSFLSPCVLPIIPLYLAYLSGSNNFSFSQDDNRERKREAKIKLLGNSFAFILGICATYFILALATGSISYFISSKRELFKNLVGIIILVLGVVQLVLTLRKKSFGSEKRINFDWSKIGMNPLTAFIMGFTFSFAWTPCVGPQLAAVLSLAASSSSRAGAFLYLGVYCLGFIIPFLLISIFTDSLLQLIKKNKKIVQYIPIVTSVLMIIFAILILASIIQI